MKATTPADQLEQKLDATHLKKTTKRKIRALYQRFGSSLSFSRQDVMEVAGITLSPAGDLIRKMREADLIEKADSHGRGLCLFRIQRKGPAGRDE